MKFMISIFVHPFADGSIPGCLPVLVASFPPSQALLPYRIAAHFSSTFTIRRKQAENLRGMEIISMFAERVKKA